MTAFISPLLRGLLLAALLLLGGCPGQDDAGTAPIAPGSAGTGSTPPVASAPAYWPTADWQTAAPEDHGFPAGSLSNLATEAATALPYYTSLLVIKDGYIVHESYHDTATETGNTAATKHHLWSVTKSVTALTVLRALTRGDLTLPASVTGKDVLDVTVADIMPATLLATLPVGDARRDISLRHSLQMRAGLAWNESAWLLNGQHDPLLTANSNPTCKDSGPEKLLCSILQRPLAYTPGSTWNYDTYTSYLVSAFFTALRKESLNSYASSHLFSALGISDFVLNDWLNMPAPYTFGGGLLQLRSRDLAKLGLLVQYRGQWEDQQIIDAALLDTALSAQGSGLRAAFDSAGEPSTASSGDIPYGWQWWRGRPDNAIGVNSYTALGMYGQQMSILPERGLIVIITCDSDNSDTHDRRTEITNFLKTRILDQLP